MTPKQITFGRALFEGMTQADAYRGAYNVENMKDAAIYNEARKLASNPEIVAYVEQMRRDAATVAKLNVAWVLRRYMQIATADINELVEVRRVCCRHCHGADHAYQWRDVEEWAEQLAIVMERNALREQKNLRAKEPTPLDPLPTDAGGFGYWAPAEPVSGCPKCFGEGTMETFVHDSRKLSEEGKLVYAGVKQTQNGFEIKTRDQDGALKFLASFLGMDAKVDPNVPRIPGEPETKTVTQVASNPIEASKIYARMVSGKAAI